MGKIGISATPVNLTKQYDSQVISSETTKITASSTDYNVSVPTSGATNEYGGFSSDKVETISFDDLTKSNNTSPFASYEKSSTAADNSSVSSVKDYSESSGNQPALDNLSSTNNSTSNQQNNNNPTNIGQNSNGNNIIDNKGDSNTKLTTLGKEDNLSSLSNTKNNQNNTSFTNTINGNNGENSINNGNSGSRVNSATSMTGSNGSAVGSGTRVQNSNGISNNNATNVNNNGIKNDNSITPNTQNELSQISPTGNVVSTEVNSTSQDINTEYMTDELSSILKEYGLSESDISRIENNEISLEDLLCEIELDPERTRSLLKNFYISQLSDNQKNNKEAIEAINKKIDSYIDNVYMYQFNDDFEEKSKFSSKDMDIIERTKEKYKGQQLYNYTEGPPTVSIKNQKDIVDVLACIINQTDGVRANGSNASMNFDNMVANFSSKDDVFEHYLKWASLMSSEEIDTFNYIYNNDKSSDKKEAYKYLENLSADLDQRWLAKKTQEDQDYAKEHEVLASLMSIVTGPIEGITGLLASTEARIKHEKIRQSDTYSMSDIWRGAVAEEIALDYGAGWSFIYSTGMSMTDSLALMAVTGGVGGVSNLTRFVFTTSLMGSRAYTSTLNDALNRGLDDSSAVLLAYASGITESVMENWSLGHLYKLEEKLGTTAMKAAIKAAEKTGNKVLTKLIYTVAGSISQGLCEGEEEFATSIINYIADCLIAQDLSNRSLSIQEYMNAGMSEEEARRQVNHDFREQVFFDTLGGIISGLTFGVFGGSMISHKVSQNMANNIYNTYQTENEAKDLAREFAVLDNNLSNEDKLDIVMKDVMPSTSEKSTASKVNDLESTQELQPIYIDKTSNDSSNNNLDKSYSNEEKYESYKKKFSEGSLKTPFAENVLKKIPLYLRNGSVQLSDGTSIEKSKILEEFFDEYKYDSNDVHLKTGATIPVSHYIQEFLFGQSFVEYNGDIQKLMEETIDKNEMTIPIAQKEVENIYGDTLKYGEDYQFKFDEDGNWYMDWLKYSTFKKAQQSYNEKMLQNLSDKRSKACDAYVYEDDYLSYKTMNGILRNSIFSFDKAGIMNVDLYQIGFSFPDSQPFYDYFNKHSFDIWLDKNMEAMKTLCDFIYENPLQNNMITYRGTETGYLEKQTKLSFADCTDEQIRDAILNLGQFVPSNFCSSSVSSTASPVGGKPIVYELRNKKGVRALNMHPLGGLNHEEEILIGPFTPYKIVDVEVLRNKGERQIKIICESDENFNPDASKKSFEKLLSQASTELKEKYNKALDGKELYQQTFEYKNAKSYDDYNSLVTDVINTINNPNKQKFSYMAFQEAVGMINKYLDEKTSNSTMSHAMYYEFLNLSGMELERTRKVKLMHEIINTNNVLRKEISDVALEELRALGERFGNTGEEFVVGLRDKLLGKTFVSEGINEGTDWKGFLEECDDPIAKTIYKSINSGKEPVLWSGFDAAALGLMDTKYTTISNTTIGNLSFLETVYSNWGDGGYNYKMVNLWGPLSEFYAMDISSYVDNYASGQTYFEGLEPNTDIKSLKFLYPSDTEGTDIFGDLFKYAEFPNIVKFGSISNINLAKTNPLTMEIEDEVNIDISDIIDYYNEQEADDMDYALKQKVIEMFEKKVQEALG